MGFYIFVSLYPFSIAAITKYYKFSTLKQQTCYLTVCGIQAQRGSHWAKIKMLPGLLYFLEVLGENLHQR